MTNQLRGSFIATGNIRNTTGCHDYPLPLLFPCRVAIESNNRMLLYGDRLNRVRDHVLTRKGSRYFEPDLTSFLDRILETQTGFFYERIASLTDDHSGDYSPDTCCLRSTEKGFGLVPLELGRYRVSPGRRGLGGTACVPHTSDAVQPGGR